ncbi:TerC family protein [Megamonas hypermegale]|uniref:TerC family protein n=1 Tax=Megamonas hypermegale TaxID=158847 RepID=UPI00242E7579|nr:TerC family protein [Megamonas hypermegale]
MEILSTQFLFALGSIILLDLVLAGDNAVVIAMASRKLPESLRRRAIYVGTAGAVVIRALMTLIATYLLTIPFLQAIGGLILLPIAFNLLKPSKHNLDEANKFEASSNFATAIKTIIIADAAMGIDNVLAIAGAAHGNMILVLTGLAISIPIVVWGSQIISNLMDRLPILITIGSAILAYTSATMILHDKIVGSFLLNLTNYMNYILPVIFIASIVIYSRKVAVK